MSKPQKPQRSWLLLEPTGAVHGDELGHVALRRFIKCLGRQFHIKLIDIRSEHGVSVNAPQPPQTPPDASQHQ